MNRNAYKSQSTKDIDSKFLISTFIRIYSWKICFLKKSELDQKTVKITDLRKCQIKMFVLVSSWNYNTNHGIMFLFLKISKILQ